MQPQDNNPKTPAAQPNTKPIESTNPKPQEASNTVAHDDKYAAALARMSEIDYQTQSKHTSEVKHFISKKMITYTVISIIVSLIGLVIGNFVLKANSSGSTSDNHDSLNELLDTTKEVRQDIKANN